MAGASEAQRAMLEDAGADLAELVAMVAPGADDLGQLIDHVMAISEARARYLLTAAVLATAGLKAKLIEQATPQDDRHDREVF